LSMENLDDMLQIDNTKNFQLKLKNLDKAKTREIVKIGLIYVKYGQDDQNGIFKNDTSSDMYKEFVNALAWPITLATHKAYLGGLDNGGSNGKEAPYYTNPCLEVVFHEVVRMPTIKDDDIQLQKKRHVGNDIVHIVFSEHCRDYSPKTISSQFNDAHVIIYPISNGMFRVQVAQKEKVPVFGPLIHGMTVHKRLLSTLVRLTAINAHKCIRYNTEGYDRPFFNRYNLIQEVVNKCAKKVDYSNYLLGNFQYDTSNVAGIGKEAKAVDKSNILDIRSSIDQSNTAGQPSTPNPSST